MTAPRESCKHIGHCELARDETGYSPEFARIIRTRWCRASYTDCARYHVARALGREAVPVDFFPSEMERVASFIASASD